MRPVFPRIFIPVLLVLLNASLALALPLTSNRDIDIQVSNDAGALYGSGANDTYWLNAPGGGLNQLHITTDSSTAGLNGQVTAKTIDTSSTSGTFWASTTGGRGYNDDIILMFSIIGPISDEQRMGAAFRKDSPELREAFNRFLAGIKKDGTYMKLVKKYFPVAPRYLPEFFRDIPGARSSR